MLGSHSWAPELICKKTLLVNGHSTDNSRFWSGEALGFLQKCSNFDQLKQVHAKIIRHGLSQHQVLGRKIIHLCSSSYGEMDYAITVFYQIQEPFTFTWNLMIRAFTINGRPLEALKLFSLMIYRGFPPDKFTFPFVIKACVAYVDVGFGKTVHGLAVKAGCAEDVFVQNTLMDMYFKCGNPEWGSKVFDKMAVPSVVSWTTMISGLLACGHLDAAEKVFKRMSIRNVVSWTSMIDGYIRHGQPEKAFELFQRMQLDNVEPNEFTLVSLLKACTEMGSLGLGSSVHDFALENGFEVGVFLGTALVDMYSKCGSVKDAREVFDKMQAKSLATWNSMITSLGVHGHGDEALTLFAEMEERNVKPDAITFVGVLSACVRTKYVNEAQRYFQYMKEQYGIAPIPEHIACMNELNKHVNTSDEISALLSDPEEELDSNDGQPADPIVVSFNEYKSSQIDEIGGGL